MRNGVLVLLLFVSAGAQAQTINLWGLNGATSASPNDLLIIEHAPGSVAPTPSVCNVNSRPCTTLSIPVTNFLAQSTLNYAGLTRVLFEDTIGVNYADNPGLATTYVGLTTSKQIDTIRMDGGHLQLTGYTRGWELGTCLLAVSANFPPGTNGCGQGYFYDINGRPGYGGQDSSASFSRLQVCPLWQ